MTFVVVMHFALFGRNVFCGNEMCREIIFYLIGKNVMYFRTRNTVINVCRRDFVLTVEL